ncbi:hypothetical protein [uncultured Sphingomonas sp.]|uniref:hypothetical protein n=1 Tax=uncultured Sphingomonas sp. TaxID=158754 RepID=UPI001576E1F0
MLLVVAELDRAIRMAPSSQVVQCRLPPPLDHETRVVRQVLEQIGLLHRIGASSQAPSKGDDEYDESVRHWRYATGTRVDEKPGDVLEAHEGRVAPALMQSMQVGLAEALINSGHHAYQADRQDGCAPFREKRWWMFTHERDGLLTVTVCDLGIGIPRSLPLTWDRAILKRVGAIFTGVEPQVAAIQMALVLGQSSTGQTHRGRGLPQIWNATQASSAGGVGISSGKAYVGFDSATGVAHDMQFKTDIQGTMISWTFQVEAADGTG